MQEGILLALAGFWAAAVSASNVTAKPNILYIMADDMSASIVGVYGQPIGQLNVTPHIDSLAKQGVRMTNLFATNSLCAPSRASIQTGTYCHVHGVCEIVGRSRIIKNEVPNFAHVVRSVGYETACISGRPDPGYPPSKCRILRSLRRWRSRYLIRTGPSAVAASPWVLEARDDLRDPLETSCGLSQYP